jgi:hypothetical protein
MPAGAGEYRQLALRSSPKTRSLVKLKVLAFGNGDAWPVIRLFRDGPSPAGL